MRSGFGSLILIQKSGKKSLDQFFFNFFFNFFLKKISICFFFYQLFSKKKVGLNRRQIENNWFWENFFFETKYFFSKIFFLKKKSRKKLVSKTFFFKSCQNMIPHHLRPTSFFLTSFFFIKKKSSIGIGHIPF